MDTKLALSGLVIATLMLPTFAYADDASGPHPITYVKDSTITAKIKTKLAAEKMNTLTHIRVDTDSDGVVYLSGHVKSQERADRAASIARDTDGVKSVTNNIVVSMNDK